MRSYRQCPAPDALAIVDYPEMDELVKQTRLEIYLDRAASQWPDHTAVVDSTGQALTYRQLHDLAGKVGAFLTACGVGPGDLVGLMMAKRCEVIALMFGTMKAGAGYVALDGDADDDRIHRGSGTRGGRAVLPNDGTLGRLNAPGGTGREI